MSEKESRAYEGSPAKRLGYYALGAVGITLALLLLVHVFIRPVAPDQPSPAGHFGEPCAACHFVSKGADMMEVEP